jgi:competence protein ComEC
MFFRWLRLYFSRQPWILKLALFWLSGLVFGFFFTPLLALSQALLGGAFIFWPGRLSGSVRLFLLVFSLGLLRTAFSPAPASLDPTWWQTHAGHTVTLVGRVKDTPQTLGRVSRLQLATLEAPLDKQEVPGVAEIILPLAAGATLREGEKLTVSGRLEGLGEAGRSREVTRVTGAVFGRLYYPKVVRGGSPPHLGSFLAASSPVPDLARLRQKLVELLARYLPEPEASLAAGVVLGQKTSLANDLATNLRRTGLTHVVVVSGYNISIVVFFMMTLSRFLGRRLTFFLTFLLAVFYALLAGGGWPVWRAVLMASFVLWAKVGGREKEALSALFFSAAVLTFLAPRSLFDLSFQLSFLATLGLLLLSEPLHHGLGQVLPKGLRNGFVQEGLSTTLAAQIATLPVLVYNFGQISLVAPLTNFLVFAAIPYLMWLSLALLLAALAAPALAPPVAALTYLPLTYLVRLAGFFGQFSWALLRF